MLRAALNLALSPFKKQATTNACASSPLSSIASDGDASESDSETAINTVSKRPRRASTLAAPSPSPAKGKSRASLSRGPVRALPTPSPTSDGSGSKGKSTTGKYATGGAGPAAHKKQKKGDRARDERTAVDDGKRYLDAGLYYSAPVSDKPNRRKSAPQAGFGIDKPAPWEGRPKSLGARAGGVHPLSVHPTGAPLLPLPLHFGATIFALQREFRLPYDIRRDFTADITVGGAQIPLGSAREVELREQSRKPMPYKSIARNVYHERKPDRADAPHVCECKPPVGDEPGCGDNCFNRMMQYCCSPKSCPCGDKCSNVSLGKRQGIPESKEGLRVIWTGNRGFGLKTMVPLKRGQFIMEYRGEIISRDESYRRVLTTYKDAKSYYFLDYDGDEVVDAGQQGNSSRFINHSCGPNVKVVRWSLSDVDEYQMGIFAKHDIPAGTELSYDYGWQDFSALAVQASASGKAASTSNPYRQRCFCGADVCTGWMGGKKNKKEEEKPLIPRKRGPKPKPKIGDAATKEPPTWSKPADAAGAMKKGSNAEVKGKGKLVVRNSPAKTPGKVVSTKVAEVQLAKIKLATGAAKSASKVVGRKAVAHKAARKIAQTGLAHAKPKPALSPASRARFAKDGHATRGAIAANVRNKVQIVKILP